MDVSKSSTTQAVEPAKSKPPMRAREHAAEQKTTSPETAARKQQEPPKPVINTQGHTTGRLLHATA